MTKDKPRFQTHVKEPHWQQVVSLIIALLIAGVWLYFAVVEK